MTRMASRRQPPNGEGLPNMRFTSKSESVFR